MRVCVIAITKAGNKTAADIAGKLGCTHHLLNDKVAPSLEYLWSRYDGIVCIMAAGIVVRSIAPLIKDKRYDPCVLVTDQFGKHVISLLSGHLGGGNELAEQVADITGGVPVITTASDNLGKLALDLWAKRNNLFVTDKEKLTRLSSNLVDGVTIKVFSDQPVKKLAADMISVDSEEEADLVISVKTGHKAAPLHCVPKTLYMGVGCNRGTPLSDIEVSFRDLCRKFNIHPAAFYGLATIDVKDDEEGITEFGAEKDLKISYFSRDELNGVDNVSFSAAVMKAVGAKGVAEPASILAACENDHPGELIIVKQKWKDVTMAVAQRLIHEWE